jgi:hypothetical protein
MKRLCEIIDREGIFGYLYFATYNSSNLTKKQLDTSQSHHRVAMHQLSIFPLTGLDCLPIMRHDCLAYACTQPGGRHFRRLQPINFIALDNKTYDIILYAGLHVISG